MMTPMRMTMPMRVMIPMRTTLMRMMIPMRTTPTPPPAIARSLLHRLCAGFRTPVRGEESGGGGVGVGTARSHPRPHLLLASARTDGPRRDLAAEEGRLRLRRFGISPPSNPESRPCAESLRTVCPRAGCPPTVTARRMKLPMLGGLPLAKPLPTVPACDRRCWVASHLRDVLHDSAVLAPTVSTGRAAVEPRSCAAATAHCATAANGPCPRASQAQDRLAALESAKAAKEGKRPKSGSFLQALIKLPGGGAKPRAEEKSQAAGAGAVPVQVGVAVSKGGRPVSPTEVRLQHRGNDALGPPTQQWAPRTEPSAINEMPPLMPMLVPAAPPSQPVPSSCHRSSSADDLNWHATEAKELEKMRAEALQTILAEVPSATRASCADLTANEGRSTKGRELQMRRATSQTQKTLDKVAAARSQTQEPRASAAPKSIAPGTALSACVWPSHSWKRLSADVDDHRSIYIPSAP